MTIGFKFKEYLGDGVYASFDGWQIVLETQRAHGHMDIVYLEPKVFQALLGYADSLRDRLAQDQEVSGGAADKS